MSLVLDSSVTLARLFNDEGGAGVDEVFGRIAASGAHVPTLWRLEVANSLTVAVRRGRISAAFRDQSLADLALLNIVSDAGTDAAAWIATLGLADRHRLTLYDAAYLELALRLNLPLATLDQALRDAAAALGLVVLGAGTFTAP